MSKFRFEYHVKEVDAKIKTAINMGLTEALGEIKSQAQRNTRVDTAQTKGNWGYHVDENNHVGYVGNTMENAIWEEFGTGVYADGKKGRQTPWYVPVEGYTGKKKPTYQGKVVIVTGSNGVQFYKTDGKKGTHAFQKASDSVQEKIIRYFRRAFKKV